MKEFTQQLFSAKALKWSKLIALTGGAQAIVQITSLISGVIIIRLLNTQEYALYTISNVMLSTIIILADSGITIAVMSEGGKVWEDKKGLGSVLSTGLELRKKFAIASIIISTPILAYLLLQHGASNFITFAIIIAIIPAFIASMSDSIYEIAPKLHQDIKPLQRNQIYVSVGRTLFSGLILLIAPFSFLAILAGAIPRILGNIRLKKIAATRASMIELPSTETRKKILKIVTLSLPGLIYYCLSGQLNVWLIAFFGQTKSIATIGAISRLTMGITLFSSVFTIIVIPRFARLSNRKELIIFTFTKLQILLFTIIGLILLIVWFSSKELLWIIGPNYVGLQSELFLAMLSSCINLLVGGTYALYSTRGWVMHPVQSISVSITSIALGLLLFNISTLKGVFHLSIFVSSIEYLNHIVFSYIKMNKLDDLRFKPNYYA